MKPYRTLEEALAEADRHGSVAIMVDTEEIRATLAREAARVAALRKADEALHKAGDLADWLPGVWADYQGICREDPCCIIPVQLEDLIHTIQARGFALRDAMDAYYVAIGARAGKGAGDE